MVLLKFIAREVMSRPGRATLTLLSIVIAVAALVSVNVATDTTSQAYQEMYEKVAGRAALEVVAEGGGLYDDSIVAQLEQVPGVKSAVPLFQQLTNLYRGEGKNSIKIRMVLMGIDPSATTSWRRGNSSRTARGPCWKSGSHGGWGFGSERTSAS